MIERVIFGLKIFEIAALLVVVVCASVAAKLHFERYRELRKLEKSK
ncbi:MAG: hypothetical protein WC242_05365 [Candidatus Paceibacterota bacterium]|jgi:hypothetical protein